MRWKKAREGALAISFVLAVPLVAASESADADGFRCLTGNARRPAENAPSRGTYSVLMPGLVTDGWPKGPTQARADSLASKWRAQRDVPFPRGVLTDGSLDTFLEWDDRAFGLFGRDIEVDLGAEYFLSRVEVYCKGNRLTEGRLYLKASGGAAFIPARKYGLEDFPTEDDRRRRRCDEVLFHDVNVCARHVRVNVRGNHAPRFAELQIWGRRPRPDDARTIRPLLPYDPAALSEPRAVEQVPPPDPDLPVPAGDGPRFAFRAVRLVPPSKASREFNRRLVRAFAAMKFNRVIHEGLNWAVNFKSWKTRYGKAIGTDELKEAIRFNESLGLKTTGGWGIAPATWVVHLGDPARVEARPGEAYVEKGRVKFRKYPGEILRRMSRVNACPLHPKNLETFKTVVDELMAIYEDEYFFAGVDEPLQWYNGSRWGCCERCRGRDPVELMADWVGKCSDHIRNRHGRIHMYQTTIILKEHQGDHPGYPGGPKIPMYRIIDRMPKEPAALVNWSYGAWRKHRGEADSSGLNRYLASKGYTRIIQNVGYTDASFAICEFTPWAGKGGADFIGASVANYGAQSLEDMARRFKFLDYVVAAQQLWNPTSPEPSSRSFASLILNGLEGLRETLEDVRLPSRRARSGQRLGPHVPARSKDFFHVDISAHANRSATDREAYDGEGWLDLGPGMDLRAFPSGRRSLCGIPFELLDSKGGALSCVMLEAAARADRALPTEAEGIPVGRRAASLVFLHVLPKALESTEKAPALVYRIHYDDGASAEFPVRYRIEVMEWLDQSAPGPGDMRIGWFPYGARPAWLGNTACGRRIIVYAAEWLNPHPDKVIQTIDMILPATSKSPGAALFGVTGVGHLP